MGNDKNNNVEKGGEGFLSSVENLYPILDFFLGLNDKVKAILDADPALAKSVYSSVDELGTEATQAHAQIDTQKLSESISVRQKAFFLLSEFFGESFGADKAFTFPSLEEATQTYDRINLKGHAFPLKKFEGTPHLLMPTNFFDPTSLFNTALGLKDSPESFPIPSGTRLVLDREIAPFSVHLLQKSARAAGKTFSVLSPSELATASKPGPDAVQIVLSPSAELLQKTIDWKQIETFGLLWEDTSVAALGWSPELLAAVQVQLGETPEEACKMTGLEEPDPAFFAQLKAHASELAQEPAPSAESSDPDDLGESL